MSSAEIWGMSWHDSKVQVFLHIEELGWIFLDVGRKLSAETTTHMLTLLGHVCTLIRGARPLSSMTTWLQKWTFSAGGIRYVFVVMICLVRTAGGMWATY